jgi:glycosyltransferase involved in cell wall biosynthesis
MKQLRICLVSGTYPPSHCGVGDYTELLAEALADRGAEVSVVTSSYLGARPRGGNPTVLPVVRSWALSCALKVSHCILQTRPDIVHFQFPTTEYHSHRLFDLLVPMLRLWPKPSKVVVTLHEQISVNKSFVPGLFRPLRHWLSGAWANAIIVVDQSYQEKFLGVSRRMQKVPCKVIPIASNIPISQMQPEDLERLREETGMAKNVPLLSYFGFIQPRKGFEQVLDVLTMLRSREIPAELMVLGELSESNRYHRDLLGRLVHDRLERHVKVLGHLDRYAVSNYLAMSDVCVLPYTDGVQPKRGSFLAAAQQGILIVTTSTAKKGLFPNENVYYAMPGEIEDMAKAVQMYAGRRVPVGSFPWRSWSLVADEHFELFDRILPGSRSYPPLLTSAKTKMS